MNTLTLEGELNGVVGLAAAVSDLEGVDVAGELGRVESDLGRVARDTLCIQWLVGDYSSGTHTRLWSEVEQKEDTYWPPPGRS